MDQRRVPQRDKSTGELSSVQPRTGGMDRHPFFNLQVWQGHTPRSRKRLPLSTLLHFITFYYILLHLITLYPAVE